MLPLNQLQSNISHAYLKNNLLKLKKKYIKLHFAFAGGSYLSFLYQRLRILWILEVKNNIIKRLLLNIFKAVQECS